ncbi:MAG TPA: hypothetical protein PKY77_11645 [Phycisphaerae bacterium]|nr:hypothetical protein [Phycisphaerae bacterium]HRY70527.1 hypothetical protein [Phycisphaerae bacterium]HSA27975.1 hypothetical protein [Phycisphaerae bacterium]
MDVPRWTTERTHQRSRLARSSWSAGGLLLAALATGGCLESQDSGKPSRRLSPQSRTYLSGIPLPAGFKLVDKLSDDQASGGMRMARHTYAGSAEARAVSDFYIEQMPLHGWTLVSRMTVKGPMSLRFENKDESATIDIRPGSFGRASVQVYVMPFSRSSTEQPSRRPVP